jgi:hypothetical protein
MSATATQPTETQGKTAFAEQLRVHDLDALLCEIDDHGFVVLTTGKLLRLLNKGNRAAGTWRALLDAWEALEGDRNELHVFETPWQGNIVITKVPTKPVAAMAGE